MGRGIWDRFGFRGMGNTMRCCVACMLPCGALDVVRIVHVNGHVQELSRSVRAGEVMKANPKHVLRKSICHRVVVLPPEAELQRGKIYFLIPTSSLHNTAAERANGSANSNAAGTPLGINQSDFLISQHYFPEVFAGRPNKRKAQSESRRISRVGVWKPHLQSISEVASL